MKKNFFQKFITKSALCLGVTYSLISSDAEASYSYGCDPCCCPCGSWYATIEALYWKPCHTPIAIARRFSPAGGGAGALNADRELSYHFGEHDPGVRVRLGYEMCNWLFDISYLYWHSRDKENITPGDFTALRPITATTSNYTSLNSRVDFWYQNVDLRGARILWGQGPCVGFVYANARWVKIDFEQDLNASGINIFTINQRSRFNGGGFGGGFGGHYGFCYGFGIAGNVGLLAILGETEKTRFDSIDTNFTFPETNWTENRDWFHVIPAFDVRFGVDYTYSCSCFSLTAEVAYELNYYIHALRYFSDSVLIQSFGGGDRTPYFNVQNIGFAGPVFRLTARF